jgi:hypothetical protein
MMMQMLTDLVAYLRAFPALGALLGSGSSMRLYAGQAPQGAAQPTMIYNFIAGVNTYTQEPDAMPLREAVIQFDIDSQSFTTCRQVGDALFSALSARRLTQGSTEFEGIFHDDREDSTVEQSIVGSTTTENHRLSIDYRIQFRNP